MVDKPIKIHTDWMFKKNIHRFRSTYYQEGFEAVIVPYRGGLTLGTKISHVLNIPLGIINYQRLDGNEKTKISLAIEPIGKNGEAFWMMNKILLMDDICDSGLSIEKIYKYLKILNPNIEIHIACIYGNNQSKEYLLNTLDIPEENIKFLHENTDWVLFGTWENDLNICNFCKFGEPCFNDKLNKTHCNLKNKSFPNSYTCENFTVHKYDKPGTAPQSKLNE